MVDTDDRSREHDKLKRYADLAESTRIWLDELRERDLKRLSAAIIAVQYGMFFGWFFLGSITVGGSAAGIISLIRSGMGK